ncbi:LysR substrate-binding domain-containing protein [Halocynthiibacter namhaensis]|uniref:LysR substrate-binding domain-containing protein n=1 Tax=Halocynthiibacter namhaensis TaxID=1290553 RepID=UPI00068B57C3|nr:LysR substrate-binding domain-containing protein [Halocynthiibacter namhaensis]
MLETWLGRDLLVRGARRSKPTAEGQILAHTVDESLGRIDEVCNDIRRQKFKASGLVVCCPPGFAFTWLFPRLLDFDLKHPEISLSISTDSAEMSRLPDSADIGIRYGLGDFPGLYVEHLMSERVFPVCAPNLLAGANEGQADPAELHGFTLLMDEFHNRAGTPPDWKFWALETGVMLPKGMRSRSFSQSNLVTQAAIQGLGVAMGREPLVAAALDDGSLVRPFPKTARSQYSYWIVCPHSARNHSQIQSFIAWVRGQVSRVHTSADPV